MREVGLELELATNKPQPLTGAPAQDAALLITMGCGDDCPLVAGAARDDWPLDDPKAKPVARVREIRDELRARVEPIANRRWAR